VFQEVNYRALFGPLVKWVAEVERTDRLAEYTDRAFRIACSGRPGPVVLALPEDILSAEAIAPTEVIAAPPRTGVNDKTLAEAVAIMDAAERPMIILGGSLWGADDGARATRLPSASAHRWRSRSGGRISWITITRTTPVTWVSA
jgi:acetolactate synthase-1/2/3 large subunit